MRRFGALGLWLGQLSAMDGIAQKNLHLQVFLCRFRHLRKVRLIGKVALFNLCLGFPMSGSALIIIDMQQGLFADRLPDDYAAVLQRLQQLYLAAHDSQRPVIFVCHEAPDSILTFQSPGWQLVEGLQLGPSDLLVRKTTPDSFLRTDLQQILQQHHINRLVIAGYASEFCVDTTVRSAAAHGYAVDLVADTHTTHDKPHLTAANIRAHHNATLAAVRSFGVKIRPVPAAEVVFAG